MSWKQKLAGEIDNDESRNYVFSPPKLLLITNIDSGLMHARKMLGEVYRDASTSSTNDEGIVKQLELRRIFNLLPYYQPCLVLRRGYTINSRKEEIHQINSTLLSPRLVGSRGRAYHSMSEYQLIRTRAEFLTQSG